MKKFKFPLVAFIAMIFSVGLASCSDNDEPTPGPNAGVSSQDYHFDLWVALERHGGMGRDVQTLVRSLNSLDSNQPQITFEGTGTEVNSVMSLETIFKGEYYYQVPVSGDRFSKYELKDNKIKVIAERRFGENSYSCRKYTHAWLDDNTLLIMASAGDGKSIVWTMLNSNNMSIIKEGKLNISMPENCTSFTTSGILAYRKYDNKLFYFYYGKGKNEKGKSVRMSPLYTAVINPGSMAVESTSACKINCETVGSAYGELLQTISFVADNNDLYIACYEDNKSGEKSYLLRIPANSTEFEDGYNGYPHDGKLISVVYMGGNKVMAYARDDEKGTKIDAFSHYYTVIDLQTSSSTPVAYNGVPLEYSSGRFSSRMAYVDGKVYFGVDAEGSNPKIYIYNAATGETVKGAEMAPGYYFEQIRVIKNVK